MKLSLKLLLGFLGVTVLLTYAACRKTDQPAEQKSEPKQSSSIIEQKFFNSNRSADLTEKALVEFILKKNDKEHFVEKTVNRIGYPRWDKAVITITKNRTTGRGNSDSSFATYYIPFVRDSQSYVNASMVIKAYPSDTTFSYKCDWQYSQRQNNTTSYTDSAEYFAIFFMVLDKKVFGHTKFNIVNTNLFRHDNHKPLRIRLDSSHTTGRSNLLESIEACQDVTISWQDCPYTGYCLGGGGSCDNCPVCTSSLSYTYCWTEWVETGGGSGSGGGSGGTGGGGSGGGGSTPPECENGPTGGRSMIEQPCEPGWNPDPGSAFDPDFDPASYPETPEILQFENDYRSQMSQQELAIFDNLPRLQQLQYLFNAKYALDKAQELYPTSVLNGNGDAFRHALFSGLNAKILGVHLAKLLGDAHETIPNSNPLENQMDLFNNQVGRDKYVYLSQNGFSGSFFKETLLLGLRNQYVPNGELRQIAPLGPNSEIISTSQLVPTN